MRNDLGGRKKITVNGKNIIPIGCVKQLDDVTLKLDLQTQSGGNFDVTGQTLSLRCRKQNNKTEELSNTSTDTPITFNRNEVDIKLRNSMFNTVGVVKFELNIQDSTGAMTTASFFITVVALELDDDAVTSSEQYSVLQEIINNYDSSPIGEVVAARNGHATLGERLDVFDSQLDTNIQQLTNKINEVATTGTTTEVLQTTTETYIQEKLDDGTIANMTIEDASISKKKLDNTLQNKMDTVDALSNSLGVKSTTYTNSFYNATYPDKTVSNDYPYQAFGTEKKLTAGKYLVYFDADFTVTFLNAEVLTGMTGTQVYTGDSTKTELVTGTKKNVTVYSMVDLTAEDNIRPIIQLRHKDTSSTPNCTIKINKCFVIKMDAIDTSVINKLNEASTSLESIKISEFGVDFNSFIKKTDTELQSKMEAVDIMKDSLDVKAITYDNVFYSETYPVRTVNNDYPYQAIGSEKSLSAGKYLVYFNADFTVNALNAEVLTAMTGKQIYVGDFADGSGAKSEVVTGSKTGVITYGIVNLTAEDNIRPVVWLRHKDSNTPNCTIKVNKCFVIKMDTIDTTIVEKLNEAPTSLESIAITKLGIDFNDFVKRTDVKVGANIVDCLGDSLTYGVGSSTTKGGYPTRLQTKLGSEWTVNNYGVGGETSHTIAGRAGGLRPIIQPNFTIPATVTASAEFEIKLDNGQLFDCKDLTINNANVNPCSINGIAGTLTKGSANGKYTFTRSEAGSAVIIKRPTTLVTNLSKRKGNIVILYMGQNDGNYNRDYLELVERCRKTIDIAQTDRYIILGMTTGSYNTNGNDDRKNMEEAMYKEFGRHYINLREYMATPIYNTDSTTIISCYALDDLGLVATDKDINNYLPNGYIPMDLITTDGTHGTDGYYDIVTTLIYERGQELLYWE